MEDNNIVIDTVKQNFQSVLAKWKGNNETAKATRRTSTVAEVVEEISPLLMSIMVQSIESLFTSIVQPVSKDDLKLIDDRLQGIEETMQASVLRSRYDLDRLEAHDRLPNLIIHGIEEEEGNGYERILQEKIVQIGTNIDVELENSKCFTLHRDSKEHLDNSDNN